MTMDLIWTLPVLLGVLVIVGAYFLGIEKGKEKERHAIRLRSIKQYRATRRP